MEKKETKKRGKAKKIEDIEVSEEVVIRNTDSNVDVLGTTLKPNETAIIKGNKVEKVSKPKKEDISNKMVKCIVVKPFFGRKDRENKDFKKGDFFFGTIERIEEVNNRMVSGRKFNALEVITNDID